MRRAVVLLGVLLAVLLGAGANASPRASGGVGRPPDCPGVVRAPESADRGEHATPVLLVHGFDGSPRIFRLRRDDRPSMLEVVASLPHVAAFTFDYSSHALQWVTDRAIGPALASSVDCLARASGHKVIVVAHSMGGLATRFAQGETIGGRRVADSLARVVTIGTPARGVILLSFTRGRVANTLVQAAVDAAGEACGEPPKKQRRRLCELLDIADAPAVSSMAPGARDLAALPRWDPRVPVHTIAADLRLRVSILGFGTTLSAGDIVATVDSATADSSRGERPLVVRCAATLTGLLDVVDRSPCSHANEVANRRIVTAVRDQVRRAVREEADAAANRSSSP